MAGKLAVKPGSQIKLKHFDAEHTGIYEDKQDAAKDLERNVEHLADLEYLLYSEKKRALLVVLQGMDTAGKDGTIRHVMTGLNPQSCKVASFKVPTEEELAHDFLWRIHKAVPGKGEIGVFNRSHYEDVLAVRVHNLVPEHVWKKRYDQINAFEKILSENNVTILKFFLHISHDEQTRRLEKRLQDPNKNWKCSPADFKERKLWPDYVKAYEALISRCSTPWAPWYIIPSNKKWFRNLAVSQVIVETLQKLHMKFPKASFDLSKIKIN